MLRRVLHAFTLLLLIGTALAIVSPAEADAVDNCNPAVEPFVVRDAAFNPFFTGSHVIGSDLIDFQSGNIQAAIDDANGVLTATTLPPGVREFYQDAITWFLFKASGRCAALAAYPVIDNIPAAPVSPYGFSNNPVAVSADASFDAASASVPAAAAASGPALAHTGSESRALAFIGVGLVGFGALALGGQRRSRKHFA